MQANLVLGSQRLDCGVGTPPLYCCYIDGSLSWACVFFNSSGCVMGVDLQGFLCSRIWACGRVNAVMYVAQKKWTPATIYTDYSEIYTGIPAGPDHAMQEGNIVIRHWYLSFPLLASQRLQSSASSFELFVCRHTWRRRPPIWPTFLPSISWPRFSVVWSALRNPTGASFSLVFARTPPLSLFWMVQLVVLFLCWDVLLMMLSWCMRAWIWLKARFFLGFDVWIALLLLLFLFSYLFVCIFLADGWN